MGVIQLLSFLSLEARGIHLWDWFLPFWVLSLVLGGACLVLLFFIFYLRFNLINRKVRIVYSYLANTSRNAYTRVFQEVRNTINRSAVETFITAIIDGERAGADNRNDRAIFTIFLLSIPLLIMMIIDVGAPIYQRNIDPPLATNGLFLLIFLLVFGLLFFVAGIKRLNKKAFFIAALFFLIFLAHYWTKNSPNSLYQSFLAALLAVVWVPAVLWLRIDWSGHPNFWILWTILTALFLFLAGIAIIDSVYGIYNNQPIYAHLNKLNDTTQRYTVNGTNAAINCTSNTGKIISGVEVKCVTAPPFEVKNSSVIFTTRLGKKILEHLLPDLTFTAPANVTYILFELDGTEGGASTGLEYQIYSYEESTKRQQDFLSALYILIAGVLFIVPSLILNIKKIWENRTS